MTHALFYVYMLCDPRKPLNDGRGVPYEPFYVGMGKDRRAFKHFTCGVYENLYNPHKARKVKKIREATGRDAFLMFVRDGLTKNEAFDLEMALIARWGRTANGSGVLTNITEGGGSLSYRARSKQAVEKRASSARGRPLTPEHKAKLRIRAIGRKHSPEVLARIAKTRAENPRLITEETREKLRQVHLGKPKPEGFGDKIRAAKLGSIRPDNVERLSKQVSMYSIDGRLLGTYVNARTAMDETGVHFKAISACCTGRRVTAWHNETLVTFRLGTAPAIEKLMLASRGRHVCAPPIRKKKPNLTTEGKSQ
jgi:hypothetical protein